MLYPLYITATMLCTISITLPPKTHFIYPTDVIVLTQPEYDNATTKTAGIPGCTTGKVLIGYANKKPIGGFWLDDSSNYHTIDK